jgi:hypothetical protein
MLHDKIFSRADFSLISYRMNHIVGTGIVVWYYRDTKDDRFNTVVLVCNTGHGMTGMLREASTSVVYKSD